MGQQNTYQAGLNASLSLVQQFPIGKVYKSQESKQLYFIKEYAYTSEQAFQQAFLKFSNKLTQKNDNVLNMQKANTKVDNTFCSTFYKIILVFEFVNYSLANEIEARNKDKRLFEEKEIWSILLHCTLGIQHLKKTQGIEHSAIDLKDIKLCEDGTIKILPNQMIGIYSEHDQLEGTTKKLAMTILSCLLMKQVTNQSNEYLEALIDKTKCSRELKKVLYFMIMEDTTFEELQQYLFKLGNDENDSVLSGVSTPVYSSHKKTIQDSNVKKIASQSLTTKNQLNPMSVQIQDQFHSLPKFETFQIENPDETQEQKNNEQATCEQSTQNELHTFSNQPEVDFKLKGLSLEDIKEKEDVTVRMIGHKKNNSNFGVTQNLIQNVLNTNSVVQNIQTNQNGSESLYTDPKLLDLIKKDLEQIQQKSRLTMSLMKQPEGQNSSIRLNNNNYSKTLSKPIQSGSGFKVSNTVNTSINSQLNAESFEQKLQHQKKPSVSNIYSTDFNIKPMSMETIPGIKLEQTKQIFTSTANYNDMHNENPEGLKNSAKFRDEDEKKNENTFKQIDNIPKRAREQQCYGNILDEQASFKKQKIKKMTTKRQFEVKRDLSKQNNYESTQTKRIGNNPTNQKSTTSIMTVSSNNTTTLNQSNQKQQSSNLSSTANLLNNEPGLEFVNQTYQKGQYKGYKLNGLRHGTGTFYYKQGGKYVGEWRQNKMNGKGTLYYPNDQIAYDGYWKDDQLHGYGTLYNEEVTQLQTSFKYQDWTQVEDFWVKYEGQFVMDNKEGKGKLYLSNGQVFEGHFKDDTVDGQGVLSRQNGTRVKGVWRKNKLLRLY